MYDYKVITFNQMLKLRNKDYSPFTLEFELVKPIDNKSNTAFANLPVKGFKGSKAIVECDGEEWLAVTADEVRVYAK